MRKIITPVFLFLVLLIAATFVNAQFLRQDGFVNDSVGVLSAEQELGLEQQISGLEKETGVEVGVAIVKTTGDYGIDGFAVKQFEEWGIGKKGADNGILLLVATEDREMRIEVGYGLEGVITDSVAGRIRRDVMMPLLSREEYYGALSESVVAIRAFVTKDFTNAPIQQSVFGEFESEINFLLFWIGIIILFVIIAAMLGIRGGGRAMPFILGGMAGRGRGGFGGSHGGGGFGGGRSGGGGSSGGF